MASTLQALTLYVTHVDPEQPNPLLGISFDAQADQEGHYELEKYLRELEPLINNSSVPPLGALRVNQLCLVYHNNKWNRAEIVSLDEIMMTGYVQVHLIDHGGIESVPGDFIRTLDMTGIHQLAAIQQCAPFAAKYVLVDVHPPHNNQWSRESILSFKRSMEGKQFRAMPVGYFNGALGVRLLTLSGELLSQRFAETGMSVPLAVRGPPPIQVQPQVLPPMPMQAQVPPLRTYQPPAPLVATPSEPVVSRRPNAYMASELEPGKSHDVYITEIETGCKLIVQPVENEAALEQLRQQLSTVKLIPLKDPAKGKPCLAVFSEDELLYRAMITSVSAAGDSCGLYYVDYGNTETRKLNYIFEIPDSLISLRLLAIRVTLANVDQQLLAIPGFSGTLKTLTQDRLFTCTVVGDQRPQQVELIAEDGSNLRDVLERTLKTTSHRAPPQVAAPAPMVVPQTVPQVMATPRSPAKPVQELPDAFPLLIKIPRPVTQRTESITITFAGKVGEMFGQLESRSLDELEAVQAELATVYDKLPQKPLIYADVCSHLSDHGVIRWSEDSAFYRVQIIEEFANDAEILFVDYGNVLRVPRREVYSPVNILRHFSRPAFGIRCRLTPTPQMNDDAWVALVSDASLELTLLKEINGVYDVELTRNPKNQAVREASSPAAAPTPVMTPQKAVPNYPSTDGWGGPEVTSPPRRERAPSSPVKKDSWSSAASESNGFADRRAHKGGPGSQGSQSGSRRDRDGNASREGGGYGERRNWNDSKNREPRSNRKNDWFLHDDREAQSDAGGGDDWGERRPTGVRSDRNSWKAARQEVADSGWDSAPVVRTPEVKFPVQPSVKGTSTKAEVVFVTRGPMEFYCQLAESMTQLDELMAKIATACEEESASLNGAKVGLACLAKFAEDGSWYRGQIVSLSGQEAEVFFVDYGNKQTTPLSDMKACSEEFAKLPPQAYRCKLTNIRTAADDAALFEEKSMGKQCQVTFVTLEEDSTYLVRLVAEEEDGNRLVLNELFGAESTQNVPAPTRYESCQVEATGDWQTVFVPWYVNPTNFYLSSTTNLTAFEEWVKDLGDFYAGLEAGELVEDEPVAGRPCVALFEECQQFYRAQIVSVKEDKAKILYVDYGNAEVVPVNKLKRITPFYLNYPKQALHCGLKGVKYDTNAGSEVSPLENSLFGQSELRALVYPELVDGVCQVDLEAGGKDVAKQLVDANIVSVGPVEIEELEPQPHLDMKRGETLSTSAEVSFIKSALEFWVQPEPSAVHELMDRIDLLATTEEFQRRKVKEVKVGMACLALFDEDQRWYRSRIEQVTGEQVRIFYVDYGNSTEVDVSQLKPLLSEMGTFPQCVKCSLDGAGKRTVETESFENVAYGNSFSVVFQSRNPEDGSLVVRLIDAEGNDLGLQLGLPSFTEVYVSHVESPHSFYLQKVSDEDAIYSLQEQLAAALEGSVDTVEGIDPDKMYAALHPDFGQYYRCRVTGNSDAEEVQVRFVDYGDCHPLSRALLRELPPQMGDVPPFAVKCSISKTLVPTGESWTQEAVDILNQLAENTVCQAEFSGQVEGSMIVSSLSSESLDVVSELVAKGLALTAEENAAEELAEESAGIPEESEMKENVEPGSIPTEEAPAEDEGNFEEPSVPFETDVIPEPESTPEEGITVGIQEDAQEASEASAPDVQPLEENTEGYERTNLDSTAVDDLESTEPVDQTLSVDSAQSDEGLQNSEGEIAQTESVVNPTEDIHAVEEVENPPLESSAIGFDEAGSPQQPERSADITVDLDEAGSPQQPERSVDITGDFDEAGSPQQPERSVDITADLDEAGSPQQPERSVDVAEEPRAGSALDNEAVSTSSEYEVVHAEDLSGPTEAGVVPSGKISPEDRILPGHIVSGTFELEAELADKQEESK